MPLEQSPETIYKYFKDSVDDLEKARKRRKGFQGAVRIALDLRPDIKENEAQRLHDNQLKYSKAYKDANLDSLIAMAEQEDRARNRLESQE